MSHPPDPRRQALDSARWELIRWLTGELVMPRSPDHHHRLMADVLELAVGRQRSPSDSAGSAFDLAFMVDGAGSRLAGLGIAVAPSRSG